jgi:hypothetical protein
VKRGIQALRKVLQESRLYEQPHCYLKQLLGITSVAGSAGPSGHSLRCDLSAPPPASAGLRYGSGRLKTNHALMSKTLAGKPQLESIPLNPEMTGSDHSVICSSSP